MIRKLLLVMIAAVLVLGTVGCSGTNESVDSMLTPMDGYIISSSDSEEIIGKVQDYIVNDGNTIKERWDEVTGSNGKQEWHAFRPEGYDEDREVYCVELRFENDAQGDNYYIVVQWFLDFDEGIMRDVYYESNGVPSGKLSINAIFDYIKENR